MLSTYFYHLKTFLPWATRVRDLRSQEKQNPWSYDFAFSQQSGPTFQNQNIIIEPVGDLGECFRWQNSLLFFWHMSPLFHFRYASGQTYSWDTIFQIKVLCTIPQEIWCHASLNLRPKVHWSLPRICTHDF